MIVWRGYGILVPVLLVVIGFGSLAVLDTFSEDPRFIEDHPWTWVIGGILAAVPIWYLGRLLNGRPGRVVIDKKTGEEIELRGRHDFFFVRMEYWAVIIVLFYAGAAIAKYAGVDL